MKCTFFGHRNAPFDLKNELIKCIEKLINESDTNVFYIGTQGRFDILVWESLTELKRTYPSIICYRVLAYLPIKEKSDLQSHEKCDGSRPIRFFVGIQKARSVYKGTDVMLSALERVKALYSERVEIIKVESVPFDEYQHLMNNSDVILDQLYSYTPAMNALEAMSRGLVVVGGGEPENYAILGEEKLRPIVNVSPNEDAVFQALKELVENPERVSDLSAQSREYIHLHHNHIKVAQQYLDVWDKG